MAIYYVGPGGNDGNSGLTWALRKLTLNGAEDVPVVAGDTVRVGPGVYREMLTVDVSGGAGTPITYIADVTGEHTDGVGGVVRITGSDNDQTAVRNYCITATNGDYRTFCGFTFDTTADDDVRVTEGENWIMEDCGFSPCVDYGLLFYGDTTTNITVRRCFFYDIGALNIGLLFSSPAGIVNCSGLVENCVFLGGRAWAARSDEVGGISIKNCLFLGSLHGVSTVVALPGGFTPITVNNCIFQSCYHALDAAVLGEITEDYNTMFVNETDRTNVNVGGNSVTFPALLSLPLLLSGAAQVSGYKFPWWFGELSEWSQVRAIAGTGEPAVDLLGIARPATAAKNSWGALQFHDMERDTATVRTGTASLTLNDAGRVQFTVPVSAKSTMITVHAYREADYTGTLPQMIIKQPGQSDRTTTDTGAVSGWNRLSDTFTPAALPPYVIVELVSNNTAAAGDYAVYFDDLQVKA